MQWGASGTPQPLSSVLGAGGGGGSGGFGGSAVGGASSEDGDGRHGDDETTEEGGFDYKAAAAQLWGDDSEDEVNTTALLVLAWVRLCGKEGVVHVAHGRRVLEERRPLGAAPPRDDFRCSRFGGRLDVFLTTAGLYDIYQTYPQASCLCEWRCMCQKVFVIFLRHRRCCTACRL